MAWYKFLVLAVNLYLQPIKCLQVTKSANVQNHEKFSHDKHCENPACILDKKTLMTIRFDGGSEILDLDKWKWPSIIPKAGLVLTKEVFYSPELNIFLHQLQNAIWSEEDLHLESKQTNQGNYLLTKFTKTNIHFFDIIK